MHLMHLPHTQKGNASLQYWMEGLKELENFLFKCSGVTVTKESLQHQIRQQNKILNFLHIETDYSESDEGQLRTRIEALIEISE